MINTSKKITFLLCIIALAALIIARISINSSTNQQEQVQQVSSNPESAPAIYPEQFTQHVDMLMTSTWNQLETNAGVSVHDCQQFVSEYGTELKAITEKRIKRKAQENRTISPETKALIQEIMIDLEIEPNKIQLVPYNGNGSPAAADDYNLYIDDENLKTYSTEAQRFIIAHEISHYKNKDFSYESAITNLVDTTNMSHQSCIDSFARSTEFRADIHAMLNGPMYTTGGIAFFNDLIGRYGDEDCSTHPRPSDRLKIAQDMDAMYAQQEQHGLKTLRVA